MPGGRKRAVAIALVAVIAAGVSMAAVLRRAPAVAAVSCGRPSLSSLAEPDASPSVPVTPFAAQAWAIAARFAPILRYDSRERLLPIDRGRYVDHTQLWALYDCRHGHDTRALIDKTPTLETLPQRPLACPSTSQFRDCHYFLKLVGVKDMQLKHYLPLQRTILTANRPVVYWHVNQEAHTVQYWFFYLFNAFLNQHQGDWEQATLALDRSMSHITRVGLSSHHGGQSVDWAQLRPGLGRQGDHPIVYVAKGSHANYFWAGRHPVPECRNIRCDRSNGGGKLLAPDMYRLLPLEQPVFAGDYGTGNFAAEGHKHLGVGINVADPQGRDLWLDPERWLANTRHVTPNHD
jgi:hypothetical protein